MGTISKSATEKRGVKGCSNSEYNICKTSCCHSYVVSDDELHDVYFDPRDLSKRLKVWQQDSCPLCGAKEWDYPAVLEYKNENTGWQWAFA
mgnify:CR=1 FL=1